ncbi:MAG: hypothetical protein ACO26G_02645, partial [Rickettsiales bacterium]
MLERTGELAVNTGGQDLTFRHNVSADFVFLNVALLTASPPDLGPILPELLTRPTESGQLLPPSPREEGSVSATLDQLSNQTDALMTIPEEKVASCREVFGNVADKKGSPNSPPQSPRSMLGGGNKEGRIRWPTPKDAGKYSASIFSTDSFFASL